MLSLIARSALVVALAAAPIAHAQTLRWASHPIKVSHSAISNS